MIKFKDLLEIIDLNEDAVHVVFDSNLRSIQVYDFYKYHDCTVGFITASGDGLVIRLFKD